MPELFACPSCRGALTRELDRLRCGCSTWPVVEEIPIFAPWARNRSFALEDLLVRHLPPPPGLSTLRDFQRGQGIEALAWLRRSLGES